MAPCLYIREAAPRVLSKINFAERNLGGVNPFMNQNLIDTSVWYRTAPTTTATTNSTNFITEVTSLSLNSELNNVQTIGDISLYSFDGRYIAINNTTKQPLFQTTSGQIIQSIYTGATSVVFVMGNKDINKPNLASNGINNNTIYMVTNS